MGERKQQVNLGKQLLEHARFGRLDEIGKLQENEEFNDYNYRGRDGSTPIMNAAWYNHQLTVDRLIRNSADVIYRAPDGHTALARAAESGDIKIYKDLFDLRRSQYDTVAKKKNIEKKVEDESIAVRKYEMLAFTLRDGKNELMLAAANGHHDIVAHILDIYPSEVLKLETILAACDADGWTALAHAARKGHYKCVKILLDKIENKNILNVGDKRNGWTPLMEAAGNTELSVVQELVNRGADIQKTDKGGRNALVWAVNWGQYEVVKFLLQAAIKEKKEAVIDAEPHSGSTAYLQAALHGDVRIFKLFLENLPPNTVKLDRKDKDKGENALIKAAAKGNKEVVELLFSFNAEPIVPVDEVDKDGNTALFHAIMGEHTAVVEYLLQKKANPNHINKKNQNARAIWNSTSNKIDKIRDLLNSAQPKEEKVASPAPAGGPAPASPASPSS